MKQFFYWFLVVVMLLLPTQLSAYTDGQIVKFGQDYYRVISAEAKTLSYLGCDDAKSGHLIVPATVFDGKDVTFKVKKIGYSAADNYKCKNITSVKIEDGIEEIGNLAFSYATLTTVEIPQSLKTIHKYFSELQRSNPKYKVDPNNRNFRSDADGTLYSYDGTVLYSVPSSLQTPTSVYTVNPTVTTIYPKPFCQIQGLKKIILPPNLRQLPVWYQGLTYQTSVESFGIAGGGNTPYRVIDGVLFKENQLVEFPPSKAAVNYTIPNGITSIECFGIAYSRIETLNLNQVEEMQVSAIWYNLKLKEIIVTKHFKTMDRNAFGFNTGLKNYRVDSENPYFMAKDGILFSKNMKTFYAYPAAKIGETYIIPQEVTTIFEGAFMSCNNITTLTIPNKVTFIGQDAFRGMENLSKVNFSAPSSVTRITAYAFCGCTSLKEITLPNSLETLPELFRYCSNLQTVNIPSNSRLKTIGTYAFTTNPNLTSFNFLGSCDLESIGANAFANTKLTGFNFPKSVKTIGTNAFSGCKEMKQATFAPDAVIETIGDGALADCGLTSVQIPASVKAIGREAFRNCQTLQRVDIPAGTTSVSGEAFKFCNKLIDIHVDRANTSYASVDGMLLSHDKKTLVLFPPGKANDKFTPLPPSITKIGDYAFYECTALKNVTIPAKVTSIGQRAFGLCRNLNTMTFLCDKMIPSANIAQGINVMAFDNGTQAPDMFKNININVRKEQESAYKNDPFYKQFKSMKTSFNNAHPLYGQFIAVSATEAALIGARGDGDESTWVIPGSYNGFNVSVISDYAFWDADSKIREVIVPRDISYIGAKAFVKENGPIENVFFLGTNPTETMMSSKRFLLDDTGTDYSEFAGNTKVYVKKSAFEAYKTAFAKTVYDAATRKEIVSPFDYTARFGYKVPAPHITARYGTFAREFDVDFSEYVQTTGTQVAAFLAASPVRKGTGDYGQSEYHVQMKGVDAYTAESYTYVPKTIGGVLLKVLNGSRTTGDFFYTIGEKEVMVDPFSVGRPMIGATYNDYRTDAPNCYVMQGGQFRLLPQGVLTTIPVHKAFIFLDSLPADAKVSFGFDPEGETTGISGIVTADERDNGPCYNLSGQRVQRPLQGVYIHKGRKTVIKQK